MEVKIGSYNICHCGDYTNRKDTDPVWVQNINVKAMADAIKRLDFDVIGLNEVYFTGVNEDVRFLMFVAVAPEKPLDDERRLMSRKRLIFCDET